MAIAVNDKPITYRVTASADGLIFSDQRFNCVFPRDHASGVFKVGTGTKPFKQSLGKDGGPFVIPGHDGKVFVTDSPLEALSLKLMQPDSTIVATNGFMQPDKIEPYLGQKDIFITLGQDTLGQEMARYLCGHFPKAKRIQPDKGKTWNECRILQIEEKEKERKQQAQVAAKARAETLTATPTNNRSTGWRR